MTHHSYILVVDGGGDDVGTNLIAGLQTTVG